MKRKHGFTLIELLIVVAIIAILAAIAVPNFLEAQTRSKVTRVMADMRTYNVALESYVVDHNRLPSAFPKGEPAPNPNSPVTNTFGKWFVTVYTSQGEYNGNGWRLTTPIAYVTSLPVDPFMRDYLIQFASDWGGLRDPGVFYGADRWKRLDFGLAQPQVFLRDIGYFLQSGGPNLIIYSHEVTNGIYDPTNGTVSGGDIYYVGHGRGFLVGNVR